METRLPSSDSVWLPQLLFDFILNSDSIAQEDPSSALLYLQTRKGSLHWQCCLWFSKFPSRNKDFLLILLLCVHQFLIAFKAESKITIKMRLQKKSFSSVSLMIPITITGSMRVNNKYLSAFLSWHALHLSPTSVSFRSLNVSHTLHVNIWFWPCQHFLF